MGRNRDDRKEVLKVNGVKQNGTNAFDFSQDAQQFKARLWRMIKNQTAAPSVQELEDDDLEWVSAAGMSARPPEEKDRRI